MVGTYPWLSRWWNVCRRWRCLLWKKPGSLNVCVVWLSIAAQQTILSLRRFKRLPFVRHANLWLGWGLMGLASPGEEAQLGLEDPIHARGWWVSSVSHLRVQVTLKARNLSFSPHVPLHRWSGFRTAWQLSSKNECSERKNMEAYSLSHTWAQHSVAQSGHRACPDSRGGDIDLISQGEECHIICGHPRSALICISWSKISTNKKRSLWVLTCVEEISSLFSEPHYCWASWYNSLAFCHHKYSQ